MPIVLRRLSRRELLGASLAAAAGTMLRPWEAFGAEKAADPHRFALIADTHIAADKSLAHRGIKPWEHFEQVRRELLALTPRPAGVLVCGDCACLEGLPGDYATFVEALKPIRAGGLTLHLGLGNHDQRENFLKALPRREARHNAVAGRYVSIVRSPRANWFILDSLDLTDRTPGLLGAGQIKWLAKTLDANADKPALVVVHHHPDSGLTAGGLEDTQALLDVIVPRKQVKAWIYGHTHAWGHRERDGVHFINLPPTAWLFVPSKPAGWVDVRLKDDGAVLQLAALKKNHPQNGQKLELKWR
jgi:Icc protein